MYGLVNKAIEELVTEKFGIETWQKIKEKAAVTEGTFISNESYPDATTYQLVGAATEVTGLSAEQILHAFGEHWVLQTAKKSYGPLLKAGGRDLPSFLKNLPNFHARIMLMYPNLKPPHFEVSDMHQDSIVLHYRSDRPGLSHFVIGLLRGLGKLFQTELTIEHTEKKADGADHDQFKISWA
jgi:hypothetical protein